MPALALSLGLPFRSTGGAAAPVPPGTPTGFTATAAESAIELSWDAQPEADTFEIVFSLEDNFGAAASLASGVTGTSFTHDAGESIQVGEKYYYWLRAVNAGGESDYAARATARSFVTLTSTANRNFTTPAGTWTLDTVLFGNTSTPVGINISFGGNDYSSVGDGTWENANTSEIENPSISGAFQISKSLGGNFTFWDAEPP